MTCEQFKESVWLDLDSHRQPWSACPADHQDCRNYAEQAVLLHKMLPGVLEPAPQTSVVGSVLEKISAETGRTSPTTGWIPAGALAVLTGCYGAVYHFGWTTIAPLTPVPDPSFLLVVPDAAWLLSAAASPPIAWIAPILAGAGILWIFALKKNLALQAGEDGHG